MAISAAISHPRRTPTRRTVLFAGAAGIAASFIPSWASAQPTGTQSGAAENLYPAYNLFPED